MKRETGSLTKFGLNLCCRRKYWEWKKVKRKLVSVVAAHIGQGYNFLCCSLFIFFSSELKKPHRLSAFFESKIFIHSNVSGPRLGQATSQTRTWGPFTHYLFEQFLEPCILCAATTKASFLFFIFYFMQIFLRFLFSHSFKPNFVKRSVIWT